jgi:hypothetical protein
MYIRKFAAATAAAGLLAVTGPVAAASAESAPAAAEPQGPPPATLTFVPPRVGPICVTIGPIIIGGNMISPGVHVCLAGTSLPPIIWPPTY